MPDPGAYGAVVRGNRFEGTASFMYEGVPYRLVMNNRVLLEAEDVLGYSAIDAAEEAKQALASGRNPKLRTVVALFYGALVQNHPGVSQDMAIAMFMDDDEAPKQAFRAALRATDVPASDGAEGNGAKLASANPPANQSPKSKAGTGKTSSGRGAAAGSRRKGSG